MTDSNVLDHSRFLRWSLRGNAIFSTLSGLVFALGSAHVAGLLGEGIPAALVASVGGQLLIFAAALVWLASRATLPVPAVVAVILADLLWVLGTIVVVQLELFSARGTEIAIVVADVVLLMAILQSVGLHRLRRGARIPAVPSAVRLG